MNTLILQRLHLAHLLYAIFGIFLCRDRLHDQPAQLHHRLQEEERGGVGGGRGRVDGKRDKNVLSFDLLQVLTLNEFLELIVPVCYLFCFIVAFYGHNSHLIGQIILLPDPKDLNFMY